MTLTEEQINRFERNIALKECGKAGQEKLLSSSVLIVGAGGLGSAVSLYLVSAGVGTLGIVDFDKISLSNLQRQILYSTSDIGKEKTKTAKEKLQSINPGVKVNTYQLLLDSKNIGSIVEKYDFIVDCTDNFPAKFLINDACVLGKKPYSHAGVIRFQGQVFTYTPGNACYRCVFKDPPPANEEIDCSKKGVLSTVPGLLGTVQATEAIKYLSGIGSLLTNRLFTIDLLKAESRNVQIIKNKECKICGV